MLRALVASTLLSFGVAAQAAMVAEPVTYEIGDKRFASTLVYDDAGAKRPGLVLVPNWYGANAAAVEKAKTIAGSKYVILVADVYGADVRPKSDDEAGAAAGAMYKDRDVLRERVSKALAELKARAGQAPLDASRIGAIGFCFGGATALELARSGADVAGVAAFHANLATDDTSRAKNIKGKVLVMNGADDTYVPPEQIATFQKEMRDAKVDWQFVNYGGAVHCFAEPDQNAPGCTYHERSAKRAFALMDDFFAEAFGRRP